MSRSYDFHTIESQAQQFWETHHTASATEKTDQAKFYCLSMMPYPSGRLHIGHVRNYTIGDVIARYQRMLGKNVMQPIAWDAFGLPAENAAIKHKVSPAAWTHKNIEEMREQLKQLGIAYDWSREVITCNPEYYRWEQWLFTELVKKGLAYRKASTVNWDPIDQTVLANEQVIDGKGWRSGAPVEKKVINQWFIKITAYAEELLKGLDNLPGWPEQVKTMQRNWIGRSEGAEIAFKAKQGIIRVFTTRPDTLFGVTYLALSPEHPIVAELAQNNVELQQFIESCQQQTTMEADLATMEKRGMSLGIDATHPLTGKPIPVWVANYVLMEYGSGAVMAVTAHDERDHEFALKYGLPIQPVIDHGATWDYQTAAMTAPGKLIHSDQFDGLDYETAKIKITALLEKQGLGTKTIHYRLRDWGVSRQRYWGTPIPMLFDDDGQAIPVEASALPVQLPITDQAIPLTKNTSFTQPIQQDGQTLHRDTDTFDTFVESSWYYARLCCPDAQTMLDHRANYWLPVDQYVGGIEHAIMHLLYARLFHKILRDLGLVDSDEPFTRLLTQGMVLKDGAKMSKSKGNTVDPQTLIDRYGADTVRLFTMFAAPPEQSLEWSDSGVEGAYRFLRKLWDFALDSRLRGNDTEKSGNGAEKTENNTEKGASAFKKGRYELHTILKKACDDMEKQQFNTIVSACMKILNLLTEQHDVTLTQEGLSILLRLLHPIAPHITHHLWQQLGFGDNIAIAAWPVVDETALVQDEVELVVQINGKRRTQISVPADADQKTIENITLADLSVKRHIEDKTIRKVIVVPKRLVNIVAM